MGNSLLVKYKVAAWKVSILFLRGDSRRGQKWAKGRKLGLNFGGYSVLVKYKFSKSSIWGLYFG